ncbi:hypothetical protein A8V23_01075 [Yersinia pestis]|uniref:Uncharacterized protein n=4 Tax=Yersinia pseudotuberculosis complex TaxID=1649845 RepID=A0A0U1QVY1_YERP3|nr:hypothetical protein YpsIP31758_2766 [Yersinia pseudotuberculosis IP 31758]ABX85023.1 hypothetical protein YpAngola_A1309 [Yersinia pestis Angola]ADV99512.1 hypothetical protein YPC_2992 [Yersinia pestis biovar Medievalis str. Harbin 35]AEL74607.1 hypothetical protein A1122_19975 [Yersinia pestis A1122]ANW13356.1 hypothetical protein BAY22_04905 [Yersinia pestis]EDR32320.1 hypothetical protein YPIP275_1234 [Yersinia pestis biovar Orientalis str. IP275]EDR40670.1 hypothetical protein YpF199
MLLWQVRFIAPAHSSAATQSLGDRVIKKQPASELNAHQLSN